MLEMAPPFRTILRIVPATALAGALGLSGACAQEGPHPRPPGGGPEKSADSEIARYCGALAPSASEARAAYQLRRLADLERQVREAVEKLETKENAAREWVTKRETMMKSATDDVIAIYAKMEPEAAAAQLADMDETIAAAVLSKLNPRVASAILAEMPPEKAAKLSTLIAGALGVEKS